jgi:predicted dehydrogenase
MAQRSTSNGEIPAMRDEPSRPLRVGVCGTGRWASIVHAPGFAATVGIELVGIYGRDADKAGELARGMGIAAFPSFRDLLDEVDALSFAVPPAIQARLALEAIEAGRHVILEKPIAHGLADADRLLAAQRRTGVTAIVFLTRLFLLPMREFLNGAAAMQPVSGSASFRSPALLPGSGYDESSWRHETFGALWDVGPHVLGPLVTALGPVVGISATRHLHGIFEAETRHTGGATGRFLIDLLDDSVGQVDDRYVVEDGGGKTLSTGPFAYDCRLRPRRPRADRA